MNQRDLTQEDMDLTVWRYMPFSKFVSLLVYQAIWFSKLSILQDQFEGMMPAATKEMMQAHDHELKKDFAPEHHWQFDEMASRNEQDSRDLLVVNCWFLGESESEEMWDRDGGNNEAVAIKSTVKQLIENIGVYHDKYTHIGKVSYVDYQTHKMTIYQASQGCERAFLKDVKQFQDENEIRIVTMNFKTKYCVSPEGTPYKESDIQGKYMNNSNNDGLNVSIRFQPLISEIRVSPKADDWFLSLVNRIIELNKYEISVKHSEISNVCK